MNKKLIIVLGVLAVLVIAMFAIRAHNLSKRNAEAPPEETQNAPVDVGQLEQDVQEEQKPEGSYASSLGLGTGEGDGRVEVKDPEPESEEPTEVPEPEAKYDTVVTIFDHTEVPNRNMDGSSCKDYLSSVTLNDFGTFWGTQLTDADFEGGDFYMVGVEQNPDDTLRGDLQSTGWLIDNLGRMNDNDAISFRNLHVIGDLSQSHVAMLCSYDWYSAYGMRDTLVVFEDISGVLDPKDFKAGDIFSATVFAHNIKVLSNVHGQRVIVVQYAVFE